MAEPQQPMSVQDAAAKLKAANPALANFDDHQLIGAVLKRRPELATQISSGPAGPPAPKEMPQDNSSFGQGFKAGINPVHQTPKGTPEMQMGAPSMRGPGGAPIMSGTMLGSGALDMINGREIMDDMGKGNMSHAAGLATGTAAQYMLPTAMTKGGEGLAALGRAAEDSKTLGSAIKDAKTLAKSVGGSIDSARLAQRYVQPLSQALDKYWNMFHKVMDKPQNMFPLQKNALQMINKMGKADIPAVSKIANELAGRSGMDYKEAEYWRRQMSSLIRSGKAEHWNSDLEKFADYLDGEIDTLANKNGVGPARKQLKQTTGEVHNLARGIAGTAKSNATTGKKIAGAMAGGAVGYGIGAMSGTGAGGEAGGVGLGALLGERAAAGASYKLLPELEQEGERIANSLSTKVNSNMFKGAGVARHAGNAIKSAGKVGKVAVPAMRAGTVASQ